MNENYLAECLEKFHDLPEEIQAMVGGFEACFKVKNLEDDYQTSLSFAIILIAIGEMSIDDLPDYLNLKFSFDKIKGKELADKLEKEIFIPVLDLVVANMQAAESEEAAAENQFGPIVNMSDSEKRELILKTFRSEIVSALQAEPNKLKDFNITIFQAFNGDEDLVDKIESLLYNNQEKLSDHQIVLDGHPASPTIANWLKDFIKKYGSDLFNEVVLAEYLSQAPNIKQLRPSEKELVRKILKLYRNLVFFPESMDGVMLENWEIFPVDRSLLTDNRDVLADRKNVNPSGHVIQAPPVTPTNSEAAEISEKQKVIFDLQKSLSRYAQNGLEYKAISQEISRLSKK